MFDLSATETAVLAFACLLVLYLASGGPTHLGSSPADAD